MAYTDLTAEEIEVGKPNKKTLWQKVRENFLDHEERISPLEGATNKIVLIDQIIDMAMIPRAGEIRSYLMTSSQISARLSKDYWELITGQSVSGKELASIYGSTLPDARNRFLRNLASSGKSIGQIETNQNNEHTHTSPSHDHVQRIAGSDASSASAWGYDYYNSGASAYSSMTDDARQGTYQAVLSTLSAAVTINNQGGNEARPDSCIVNNAIKVDEDFTQLIVSRIPANCSIVSATVSSLNEVGTAGALEVDILKGSSLASVSSMLNSNVSLSYLDGANATSSEGDFSSSSLTQNDFLIVDLKALQTAQTRFYVSVYAEAS